MAKISMRQASLIFAEEFRLNDKTNAYAGMETVVIEQILAVAIVILKEEILILIFENTIVQFDDCVPIHVPALSLHQSDGEAHTVVAGGHCDARLIDAGVMQDVLIVFAIDDRNPVFSMNHEVRVKKYVGTKRNSVPAA